MKTIGERIRKKREGLGWSQRRLAHAIGLRPETVCRWETGATTPGLRDVKRAAAVLGTTLDALAR